jgi:hypothetical protein
VNETVQTPRGWETRLPIAIRSAEVVINATLEDGTLIEMRVPEIRFAKGQAAVVKVDPEDPFLFQNSRRIVPASDWYLDLDGKMIPNEKGHSYTVSIKS